MPPAGVRVVDLTRVLSATIYFAAGVIPPRAGYVALAPSDEVFFAKLTCAASRAPASAVVGKRGMRYATLPTVCPPSAYSTSAV